MTTAELVQDSGIRYALIIRNAQTSSRTEFYTSDDMLLQVGAFNLPPRHEIVPHIHIRHERQIPLTGEVLVIQEGRMQVDFYRSNQTFLGSRILEAGDVIVLMEGGHGFKTLSLVRMLEIKQGPYVGEKDKMRFARPVAIDK